MTVLELNEPRFESQTGQEIFVFFQAARQTLVTTQPPIQGVPADFSLPVKPAGREAGYLSASSAEVKNEWKFFRSLLVQGQP